MRKEKLQELKNIIKELKISKLEQCPTSSEGNFIKSEVYKCYFENSETNDFIVREKLIKGNKDGNAVIIVPMLESGEVILTVEPRVFTKRTVCVGLPAGYIENTETSIEAAKRELQEETGAEIAASDLICLGGFYQDVGVSAAYIETFLAQNINKISAQNLDKDEYIKYFQCNFDEALELVNMGYIEEAGPILTLLRAKQYLDKNK